MSFAEDMARERQIMSGLRKESSVLTGAASLLGQGAVLGTRVAIKGTEQVGRATHAVLGTPGVVGAAVGATALPSMGQAVAKSYDANMLPRIQGG